MVLVIECISSVTTGIKPYKKYNVLGDISGYYVIQDEFGEITAYHKDNFRVVEQINCVDVLAKSICRPDKPKVNTDAPKFGLGEIIIMRYNDSMLPDRWIVLGQSRGRSKRWVYECYIESTGNTAEVQEDEILRAKSKLTANVYNTPPVKRLIHNGYLWVYNYNPIPAMRKKTELMQSRYVHDVFLTNAYDKNGDIVKNKVGLWIRYNNFIKKNGKLY